MQGGYRGSPPTRVPRTWVVRLSDRDDRYDGVGIRIDDDDLVPHQDISITSPSGNDVNDDCRQRMQRDGSRDPGADRNREVDVVDAADPQIADVLLDPGLLLGTDRRGSRWGCAGGLLSAAGRTARVALLGGGRGTIWLALSGLAALTRPGRLRLILRSFTRLRLLSAAAAPLCIAGVGSALRLAPRLSRSTWLHAPAGRSSLRGRGRRPAFSSAGGCLRHANTR